MVRAGAGLALLPMVFAGLGGPGPAHPALPYLGRQAAQRLAQDELSKAMYHPAVSLPEQWLNWLVRLLQSARAAPGGLWGLVALAAITVIAAAAVQAWLGPVARSHKRAELAPPGRPRTARDHRQRAQRLAEAGDYAGAIRECLRAIAAELDERQVLPSQPGWTADEFAEAAGRILPLHANDLRAAAALFDEVCYGQRLGTAQGYQRLAQLDDRLRASAGRVRPADEALAPAGAPGQTA